ncbi:wasp family member 3a [Anaeramoeba flamelloides]|uniref:Wasp family member 3a n=1 Tax=Anaeramoeba flamelloides TaxID=1746091 RepID=A0ABQ8YWK1_9EUKA|nr:wasp family member 3a [Anaeramoeba flamelloides]
MSTSKKVVFTPPPEGFHVGCTNEFYNHFLASNDIKGLFAEWLEITQNFGVQNFEFVKNCCGALSPNLITKKLEDPNEIVQARTQGSLVALLVQLKDLATLSHSVFEEISTLTGTMTKRILSLNDRATEILNKTLPEVEEQLEEVDPLSLCNIPRARIALELGEKSNLFSRKTILNVTKKLYEEAHDNPDFTTLDDLNGHKHGYTSKKYSNPRFFFERWYAFMVEEAKKRKEQQREERRKNRKKKKRKRAVVKVKVEKVSLRKLDSRGAEFTDNKVDSQKKIVSARIIRRKVRRKKNASLGKKSQKKNDTKKKIERKKSTRRQKKKKSNKNQDDLPSLDELDLPDVSDLPDMDDLGLPPDLDELDIPEIKKDNIPPPPEVPPPNFNIPNQPGNTEQTEEKEEERGKSNLLLQIRLGRNLKSAKERKLAEKTIEQQDPEELTVADIMLKTMSIRKAVEFSDDETEEEYSEEEWDDF